jgi:hypothetical protein
MVGTGRMGQGQDIVEGLVCVLLQKQWERRGSSYSDVYPHISIDGGTHSKIALVLHFQKPGYVHAMQTIISQRYTLGYQYA